MEKLVTQYSKSGFDYKLIKRTKNTAVFEQRDSESGNLVAYEVMTIKIRKEQMMFGALVPAGEVVPSAEQWGLMAWTIWKKEDALLKQQELQKRYNDKKKNGR